MNIGIIGEGVVGQAIHRGFKKEGHRVLVHDIKYGTSSSILLETDIIYICVPTNSAEDGSCDTSIVEQTLQELTNLDYKGIVAIKSTIIPGTFTKLESIFDKNRLCHVPEFLREKYAYEDFVENHNVLIIGTNNTECETTVRKCHGDLPKSVYVVTPSEAEFVKYFSNVFKAYKTVFANSFGKLCDSFNVDYSTVLKAYEYQNVKETDYLHYAKELGGFGGMCLPKDTKALAKLVADKNLKIDTFEFIINENRKHI